MSEPGAPGLVDRTFRSLRVPNFRRFFFGQLVSMIGFWVHEAAELWLVLTLTHSGLALGVTAALNFLPMLLVGPWGGVLADRLDKRRLLLVTQTAMAVCALVLATLTLTDVVQLWMVYLLALCTGLANAFDNPTRRSFLYEMSGPELAGNAASLWGTLMSGARAIGPAIAGFLIAAVGVGVCFAINAASFVAALFALATIDVAALYRVPPAPRRPGQLRDGLRYAWATPRVRLALLLMAVIGTLSFNFQVVFPLLTKETFHSGSEIYGIMLALVGFGSLVGSLVTASRPWVTQLFLVGSALAFGVTILLVSGSPSLAAALAILPVMGGASGAFITSGNASLQQSTDPSMMGRVMALYAVVFLGSTPIGAPFIGWISGRYGPRWGFAIGGIAAVAAGVFALVWLRRVEPRGRPADHGPGEAVASTA